MRNGHKGCVEGSKTRSEADSSSESAALNETGIALRIVPSPPAILARMVFAGAASAQRYPSPVLPGPGEADRSTASTPPGMCRLVLLDRRDRMLSVPVVRTLPVSLHITASGIGPVRPRRAT